MKAGSFPKPKLARHAKQAATVPKILCGQAADCQVVVWAGVCGV